MDGRHPDRHSHFDRQAKAYLEEAHIGQGLFFDRERIFGQVKFDDKYDREA